MRISDWSSDVCSSDLGLGEGELAATLASPRAGSGQASHGALADHIPLKLRQCGKNAEHHPARWRRGVDLRAPAGEHPQTDTAIRQILHRADQVRSEERTSELQSLMRFSYDVFCLRKNKHMKSYNYITTSTNA